MREAPVPLPSGFAGLVADYRWTRDEAGESGGAVFRLDGNGRQPLYLKYGVGHVATDISDEAARLRWLAGRLPVPRVVQAVTSADAAWLLTSAVAGKTGDALLRDSPGALPTVIAGAAGFLRRLHRLPVAHCPFEAGHAFRLAAAHENIAAGRVDTDDFDADHAGWSAQDLWNELASLQPFAAERVVTHGDYSLGNILFEDGAVTGCIDVGRLGLADPYQDIAIFWANLTDFGADAQAALIDAMGIVLDERRLHVHRCLDELF